MLNHHTSTEPVKESRRRAFGRRQIQCLAIVVFAGAALGLQYWIGLGKSSSPPAISSSKVSGKQFTSLKLAALTEESQDISSEALKGKVTLINFWGPWCVECRIEMPFVDGLRKRYQEKQSSDFSFVSVSCGPEMATESIEDLKPQTIEYLRSTGMQFPVHWDPHGETRRALLEMVDISNEGLGYPLNVLLDREATICGLWIGSSDAIEKDIQDSVERELVKSAP